jgi:hypothetical protein
MKCGRCGLTLVRPNRPVPQQPCQCAGAVRPPREPSQPQPPLPRQEHDAPSGFTTVRGVNRIVRALVPPASEFKVWHSSTVDARREARMRDDTDVVRTFLVESGEKPQMTNWVAEKTQLDRGRALACLRELALDGEATRLPLGWVLTTNKGARPSEAEEDLRFRRALTRVEAECLIHWINNNWPIEKQDLLDAIDRVFPPPSR